MRPYLLLINMSRQFLQARAYAAKAALAAVKEDWLTARDYRMQLEVGWHVWIRAALGTH